MFAKYEWNGPKRAALTLAALALMSGISRAGGMSPTSVNADIVYNTSGIVGTTGITGTNVISFVPVQNATLETPSSLSLGTFVVSALPSGQSTVYNNTPFAVSYATQAINGMDLGTQPLLTVTGFLNGTITGADQSNVIATFNPISNPSFSIGSLFTGSLSLPSPERTLVPSSTFGGQSTAEAFILVASAVPEPATIALFLTAGAGLGLRKRLKRGR